MPVSTIASGSVPARTLPSTGAARTRRAVERADGRRDRRAATAARRQILRASDGSALGIIALSLLLAGARNAFDRRRRPAGFFGDLAVLLYQEAVRGLVAVDAAGQRARHLSI